MYATCTGGIQGQEITADYMDKKEKESFPALNIENTKPCRGTKRRLNDGRAEEDFSEFKLFIEKEDKKKTTLMKFNVPVVPGPENWKSLQMKRAVPRVKMSSAEDAPV